MVKNKCKMTEVKVSICCLVFNHGKYIKKCIDGFLMQKANFAYEIIIHDDCSTDGTIDILKEYEKKYPRIIKVIYETENQYSKGGMQMEDLFLYPHAHGEYIALCEGDDFWVDPYKLQRQVDFLDSHSEYGLCYTDFNMYYQNSNRTISDYFKQNPNTRRDYKDVIDFVVNRGFLCPATWLFRAKFVPTPIHSFKAIDGSFADFAYFLHATKVKYLEYTTATYRVLEESASHSKNYEKIYKREMRLLEAQKKLCEVFNRNDAYVQCLSVSYKRNLKNYILNDKVSAIKDARTYIQAPSFLEKMYLFIGKYKIARDLFKTAIYAKRWMRTSLQKYL